MNRRRRRWMAHGTLVVSLILALALIVLVGRSTRRAIRGTSSATTSAPVTPTTPSTPASPPLAAKPPPSTETFGANVNLLFNDRNYAPQELSAQLQALRQTGATVARSDTLWELSEPAPPRTGVHDYDWSFDDTIAGALAAHRLKWLPILDYSAFWDESIPGQEHSPPASAADYAAYAGAFAARYGSGGAFWRAHPNLTAQPVDTYEIWNEPDNYQFWTPQPDPARYADLYLAARAAITAADPGARVLVGGLTQATTFLPALLAARPQLRGHLDGVAIHPYGEPGVVLAKVQADRRTLVSLGMSSVPLYVTEFGWSTHPRGGVDYVPAAVRPSYIRRTLTALGHLDCGLAATILYTWVTPQRDPNNLQDWFGIHPPHRGSSPDTVAFADGLRDAHTAGPRLKVCSMA